MSSDDRELSFACLIAAGHTPRQAWQVIRDGLAADPVACRLVAGLPPAVLDVSRQMWARHGLPAPFDDVGVDDMEDPKFAHYLRDPAGDEAAHG